MYFQGSLTLFDGKTESKYEGPATYWTIAQYALHTAFFRQYLLLTVKLLCTTSLCNTYYVLIIYCYYAAATTALLVA